MVLRNTKNLDLPKITDSTECITMKDQIKVGSYQYYKHCEKSVKKHFFTNGLFN